MPDNTQFQDIVNKGIEAGQNRNQIVASIYDAMGNESDLGGAFKLYNELSKSSGLLLDKDGRDKLLVEIVALNTREGKLERDSAVNAYVERGRVAKMTAVSHLKSYCAEHGIAFPIATRVSRDLTAVKAALDEWNKTGVKKDAMIAGLKQHFQYTDSTAADAYRKIGKELGFVEAKNAENRVAIASWFKANGKGARKDVVAALSKEFGITENTASGYHSMYLFALAYEQL